MAFTAGVLAITAGVGFGIGEIINGFSDAPDKPDQPALPDQKTADQKAATTVADQRRTLLATGGQTDYTGGGGVLEPGNVNKNILLGG